MTRWIFILLPLITAVIFSACRKNNDSLGKGNEPIKKYVSKITGRVFSSKRASVTLYEYDAQKRCTKIISQTIDTVGGVPQVTVGNIYNFSYNGSDSKLVSVGYKGTFGNAAIHFYYNQEGKLIKDSASDGRGYAQVTSYTYATNRIYATGYSTNPVIKLTYRDTAEFNGENVVRHSFAQYNVNGSLAYHNAEKFTYDDKVNLWQHLNIAGSFFSTTNRLHGSFSGLNKNNYISKNEDDLILAFPYNWTVIYRFGYDRDGYPVSMEFTDGFGPASIGVELFEYLP